MLGATPLPAGHGPTRRRPRRTRCRTPRRELGLRLAAAAARGQLRARAGAPRRARAADRGPGVRQPARRGRARTCRLCGECDIGCNDGAKNSLDHTYLSAARHHGADLRTLARGAGLRPRPDGGYEVDYVRHDADDGAPAPRPAVRGRSPATGWCWPRARSARPTCCCATARAFPGLSPALGTRFSRQRRPADASCSAPGTAAGSGRWTPAAGRSSPAPSGWPTSSTGTARGRGAYIEDGGYPAFVDWLVGGGRRARRRRGGWPGSPSSAVRPSRPRPDDATCRPRSSDLIGTARCRSARCRCSAWAATSPTACCGCAAAGSTSTGRRRPARRTSSGCARRCGAIAAVLGAKYADNPHVAAQAGHHRAPGRRRPHGP